MMPRCLGCEKTFEAAMRWVEGGAQGGEVLDQPSLGVIFTADGNYGTQLWDPVPYDGAIRQYLVVYVCDDCLKAAAERGDVIRTQEKPRQPDVTYERWTP